MDFIQSVSFNYIDRKHPIKLLINVSDYGAVDLISYEYIQYDIHIYRCSCIYIRM